MLQDVPAVDEDAVTRLRLAGAFGPVNDQASTEEADQPEELRTGVIVQ